ncbi:hypothetical protein NDU88_002044 [Pleurodeles waltl]|uniref:Uncharacterized protein n=1 Tax=Pleurodeles waltl TaxID=8319 RepID=A0AAV7RA84_PLEWA|nr:hypothetical protein NDU88_002044 [Pleurodeles waltl]
MDGYCGGRDAAEECVKLKRSKGRRKTRSGEPDHAESGRDGAGYDEAEFGIYHLHSSNPLCNDCWIKNVILG